MNDEEFTKRAREVRLITLDVDGVLTDGRIYVDDDGREHKAFSALDGQGIKMLQDAGIVVAWITGSIAPAVVHRAKRLAVEHVLLGASNKRIPWEKLRASLDMPADACAHAGDDLPDVPLFAACGLAVTVPHATESVRRHAHYVTRREGGAGAVREVAELILSARGVLADVEAPHLGPSGGP